MGHTPLQISENQLNKTKVLISGRSGKQIEGNTDEERLIVQPGLDGESYTGALPDFFREYKLQEKPYN